MNEAVIHGYADGAEELIRRYEALSVPEVYAAVSHLFPEAPARMLDVGAGTGRDAAWFADRGHDVLAVEPVAAFREAGASLHPVPGIAWLDDSLPALSRVVRRNETFDFILVSGVWQHLDPDQRRDALPTLAALAAAGGRVIVSLRHGPGAPARPCFPAPPQDTIYAAAALGLRLVFAGETGSIQQHNRAAGVTWTWLAFSRG